MFKKRTTGVEIGEFFMRVGETPEDAVKRAEKEYDLPKEVYYDKQRNVLKTIADGNSIAVTTSGNSTKGEKDELDLPPVKGGETDTMINKKESYGSSSNRVMLGKASKEGMGMPITKKIDDITLPDDVLKTKPFFDKKKKSNKKKPWQKNRDSQDLEQQEVDE